MKVIVPISITDSVLVSSSLDEPDLIDPIEWNPLTGYTDPVANGPTRVSRLTTHKLYENLSQIPGSASAELPELSVNRADPKWVEVGSTNKWAMFDILRNTASISSTTTISIQLMLPDTVDSLAFLGMVNVYNITVKANSSDLTERYSATFNISERSTVDTWYEYFYRDFISSASTTLFDLPTTFGPLTVDITFSGAVGMQVGSCVAGATTTLGNIQLGATIDSLNFSTVDRDTFGSATLIQRRSVPKTSQRIFIDKNKLASIIALKNALDAVPAVWVGIEDTTDPYYEAFVIVGFYRDFTFAIDNPIGASISLELEEI